MSKEELAIEIENISFQYSRKAKIFDDFSCNFQSGATAILGPNGSGKTTLFDLILGFRKVQSGAIRFMVNGRVIKNTELRSSVGFLPQVESILQGMTVGEHLSYAAWLRGCNKAESSIEAARVLDLVDLKPKRDQLASKISGGQKRRLGIAMALINQPKFILLDEPAGGLDPEQRFSINKIIGSSASSSIVLSSTHQVEDLPETYGQILLLRDGAKLFQGATEEFLAGGSPLETYVKRLNGSHVSSIS